MQNKIISKAPGRVCLFGDHQDYLGLPIIATTIDKEITIKAIKNNTQEFKIFKKDLDIHDSISLNQNISSDEKDFLRIALRVLKKYENIKMEIIKHISFLPFQHVHKPLHAKYEIRSCQERRVMTILRKNIGEPESLSRYFGIGENGEPDIENTKKVSILGE